MGIEDVFILVEIKNAEMFDSLLESNIFFSFVP